MPCTVRVGEPRARPYRFGFFARRRASHGARPYTLQISIPFLRTGGGRATGSPLHPTDFDPFCAGGRAKARPYTLQISILFAQAGEPRLAPTPYRLRSCLRRRTSHGLAPTPYRFSILCFARRLAPTDCDTFCAGGRAKARPYGLRYLLRRRASQGSPLHPTVLMRCIGRPVSRPYNGNCYSYSALSSFHSSARASMTSPPIMLICAASRICSLTEAAQGPLPERCSAAIHARACSARRSRHNLRFLRLRSRRWRWTCAKDRDRRRY